MKVTLTMTEEQALRERDRWIPVSERLPDNDRYVLLNLPREIIQAYWHNGRGCWRSVMGMIDEPCTHWRELPAPPEKP